MIDSVHESINSYISEVRETLAKLPADDIAPELPAVFINNRGRIVKKSGGEYAEDSGVSIVKTLARALRYAVSKDDRRNTKPLTQCQSVKLLRVF